MSYGSSWSCAQPPGEGLRQEERWLRQRALRKAPATGGRPCVPPAPVPLSLLAPLGSAPPPLGAGDRQAFRARAKPPSPRAGEPRGTLFPGCHRAPVPRQVRCPCPCAPARLRRELGHNTARRSLMCQGELAAGSRWCPAGPETLPAGKLHHQPGRISGSPRARRLKNL